MQMQMRKTETEYNTEYNIRVTFKTDKILIICYVLRVIMRHMSTKFFKLCDAKC